MACNYYVFLLYCGILYLIDPGDERGHTGEDCRLLRGVTASSIHKTSHSLYIPLTIPALTVQRASRVALEENGWKIMKQ